ncbi:hypothetical protein BC831DRAFT_405681 [Entophlyctis helioformis]|nr:hypothetical protein BC831DRAFT_405681 [Entophlyctis helioformis]
MARIAKILDLIARTWNLDLDTDVHAKIDPFRRSGSDTALNQDEAERVPVAPGVYAPETLGDSANLLTRRGREQIRKGWRKSTAEDVNVIPSSRARRVISSEDSPLLVSIALLLAYATDASARFLHGFTTWIPLVRSEPFWRESMSSWQRLLRSLILLLVAFIVLAIVWLVFKILGYMFFSSPQPAASSVGAGNRVRPGGNAQPTYGRSGQAYVGSGGHGYQAYNPNRFV